MGSFSSFFVCFVFCLGGRGEGGLIFGSPMIVGCFKRTKNKVSGFVFVFTLLDLLSPSLSAPGSPRMVRILIYLDVNVVHVAGLSFDWLVGHQ